MDPSPPAPPTQSSFDEPVERRLSGSLKWDKFAGRDVLPFWVADMDFRSPDAVIDAARSRVEHGVFGYGMIHEGLVEAVRAYLRSEHRVDVPEDSLVWLPGLVPALNMACRAAGEPGDTVMTCSPVYPPFLSAPRNADRELIDVPLTVDGSPQRWTFDFEAMEAAVRPNTRLFLLCNPHNPTGTCYRRDQLDALLAFCQRHDLVLCADEIHCDLILEPDAIHHSLAAADRPHAPKTISLLSPSKTYNIAGLAFAFAIIHDPALRARFRRAGQGFLSEIEVVAPWAAEAAYRHGAPWRAGLLAYLRANRDALYTFAAERFPQVRLWPMEATYLAWMDVRALELDDPAGHFEKHGVGLSDGTFFGLPGFVRFNFGCRRELMLEGLRRMDEAVAAAGKD